jgi:sporulation protein YlmC with PRC-barrel domain
MTQETAPSSRALIESDRVEGTPVYDRDGRHVGTIKRLMIQKVSGQVVYAVTSFSGFLSLGDESYAIPWGKLKYDVSLGGYRTDITESELHGAPSFARGENHDLSDNDKEDELHAYFRIPPSWRAM